MTTREYKEGHQDSYCVNPRTHHHNLLQRAHRLKPPELRPCIFRRAREDFRGHHDFRGFLKTLIGSENIRVYSPVIEGQCFPQDQGGSHIFRPCGVARRSSGATRFLLTRPYVFDIVVYAFHARPTGVLNGFGGL